MVCMGSTLRFTHRSKFGTGDADGVHISVKRKFRVSRQMPLAFRESFDFTTEHHGKCPTVYVLLSPMWHGPHFNGMSKYYHVPGPISSVRGSLTGFSCREANTREISSYPLSNTDVVLLWTSWGLQDVASGQITSIPYLVSIEQTETETTSALAFGAFLQGRCSWRW